MAAITRRQRREHLEIVDRVSLLEDDADDAEAREIKRDKKLDGIYHLLWGILASLSTGAVLMALNLLVKG